MATATWKKVIVSGSDAVLNKLNVGTNQVITTSSTQLTGSFTGSFSGDGSGLTNLSATAVFPATPLDSFGDSTKVFINDSANKFVSGSQVAEYVFQKVSGDITISNTGTATIAANSVALGTDTTGNYVDTVTATSNAGILVGGTAGEGQAASVGLKNASSLSGNKILKWDNTNAQLTNTLLSDDGTNITGATSIQLTGTSTSLTGSFSGSFYGAGIGSLSSNLTLGVGLTSSGSTFNGTSAVTVAVGAGTLITASGASVAVKTSNLNEYQVPFYSNGFLSGSKISDSGSVVTIGTNLNVLGNITASGTLSYLNVQNLAVTDQYIILNSGSSDAARDSGIIVNRNVQTTSGSAFYLSHAAGTLDPGRWAVASPVGIKVDNSNLIANEWMVSTKLNTIDPTTELPQWGGTTYGKGNMWVNTTSGDIFIYS